MCRSSPKPASVASPCLFLDVGCGRGEWLELLREHQLQGSGIDLNRVVLAICRENGLPVLEAEAIQHLRSLPEASLGAVTAFHVIEHLPNCRNCSTCWTPPGARSSLVAWPFLKLPTRIICS
jgi:2-polyprenyl-3-methyl-5-hydroxy-6-metoxy-1,4-benzoquinol methylase